MKYVRGDEVWIECGGRTVAGSIMLASENGRSIMLAFEAILGGHAGMCPVLRDDDGVYRSIINGVAVRIMRKGVRND